jgi:hypothetical protein
MFRVKDKFIFILQYQESLLDNHPKYWNMARYFSNVIEGTLAVSGHEGERYPTWLPSNRHSADGSESCIIKRCQFPFSV